MAEMMAGLKVLLPPAAMLDHSIEQKKVSMMAQMMAGSKVLPLAATLDHLSQLREKKKESMMAQMMAGSKVLPPAAT